MWRLPGRSPGLRSVARGSRLRANRPNGGAEAKIWRTAGCCRDACAFHGAAASGPSARCTAGSRSASSLAHLEPWLQSGGVDRVGACAAYRVQGRSRPIAADQADPVASWTWPARAGAGGQGRVRRCAGQGGDGGGPERHGCRRRLYQRRDRKRLCQDIAAGRCSQREHNLLGSGCCGGECDYVIEMMFVRAGQVTPFEWFSIVDKRV